MMERSDKVALVTGGGVGIGEAIARRLAQDGMEVIVSGRRMETLAGVVESIRGAGGRARAIRCDVAKPEEITALAKESGRVDVLVNNAGIARSAPLVKTDDAMWAETLAVNLTGTFLCTRALLPGMMERGWGRVINIASVAGKHGALYTTAYCASKHGVVGLTRALALEVARKGITVNAVCPGWVETEMADRAVSNIASKTKLSSEAARATLAGQSPQNRLMTAPEVAALVGWLAGDAAAGITAQAINLDGGGDQG